MNDDRHQPWSPSLNIKGLKPKTKTRSWENWRYDTSTSAMATQFESLKQRTDFRSIPPRYELRPKFYENYTWPQLKKSHLHTLRYLSRMEISGVKSDLKIIFFLKKAVIPKKQLICTKTTVASAREQLTQEGLIYIAKFPGVPRRRSQFVCCHYFESNTICWPCAPPSQLVCQGLIFGNGPRPQIASEEKSRCTRSNSAPQLRPKEC